VKSSFTLWISLFCILLKVRCQHFSCFSCSFYRDIFSRKCVFGYEGKLTLIFPKDLEIFNAVWKRFGFVLCTFQTAVWCSWLKLKVKAVPTLKGHETQLQAVKLFQMSIVLVSRKFSLNEAQIKLTQNIYSRSKESAQHQEADTELSEFKEYTIAIYVSYYKITCHTRWWDIQ